jgi:hypothetical protein
MSRSREPKESNRPWPGGGQKGPMNALSIANGLNTATACYDW